MTQRLGKPRQPDESGMKTSNSKRSGYIMLPIEQIKDDPKNENVHTDEQINMLRASIRSFGQPEDVLIDRRNMLISGHGIKRAMLLEGKTEISCKYSNLKGARRDAYRIAANQLARLSYFDPELFETNARAIASEMGKEFDPAFLGLLDAEWQQIASGQQQWQGRTLDPDSIGDYDPNQETFLIKIESVKAADKVTVLARVGRALKGTEYEARAY